MLAGLLTVARTHRPTVSVIRSGHPLFVFGTTALSDHPQGRAFDTWAIDGHAVVDPRTPRRLVEDYMHAVAAAGSYNVGGPYLLGVGTAVVQRRHPPRPRPRRLRHLTGRQHRVSRVWCTSWSP